MVVLATNLISASLPPGPQGVQGTQGPLTTGAAGFAGLMGYTTTATAGGTTTLSNTSTMYQLFTGTTTQTITLPVTSTLTTGWTFHIVNNSTGNLTLNSSGGNLVATIIPSTTVMVTCILTSGTTAASWEFGFTDFGSVSGTGSNVLSDSPVLSGNILQSNATSGSGAIVGEQTFRLTANGSAIGPTIADFFGANSSISLEASSVYHIEYYCIFTKNTTAGNISYTLLASSAPTVMILGAVLSTPATGIGSGSGLWASAQAASANATTAVTPNSVGNISISVNHIHMWRAVVTTNLATNLRLQTTQGAGTLTPLAGSYYTVKKISSSTGTFVA